MRVLVVGGTRFLYGGIERLVGVLLPELEKRGHEVGWIVNGSTAPAADTVAGPVWTVPITEVLAEEPGPEMAQRLLEVQRSIRDAVACFRPDVIHYHPSAVDILLMANLMRRLSAPVVTTIHLELRVLAAAKGGAQALERLLQGSRAATVVSQDVAGEVAALVEEPRPPLAIVRNGLAAPVGEVSAPPGHKRLLSLSRLVDDKGVDILVDAMPGVLEAHGDARLEVAGTGPERASLEAQAAALGLGDAVAFTGPCPPEAVHARMSASDIVVMPSRWREPFGLVALEAALACRPVVASATGGLREIVVPGETGSLVPPCNPQALTEAIVALLDDPQLAVSMGARARTRAVAEFGVGSMIQGYENVYRSVALEGAPHFT
ncbi:MAG: glycosyltransferase family 4 protein [Pseudomonadota bacterium]